MDGGSVVLTYASILLIYFPIYLKKSCRVPCHLLHSS